jgi:hypothetical protein
MEVLGRLVRIVVMERAIVFVVMLNLLMMRYLVRHAGVACGQQRSALHSKALQGQAQQKEDTDESTHNNPWKFSSDYSSGFFSGTKNLVNCAAS